MRNRALEPLEPRRLLTLVIDYPMEEGGGTTVADVAPMWRAQDATLFGGAEWTTTDGQVLFSNRGISLNGTDASLLTDDIGWHIGQSATLSLWIKTTDVGGPNAASSPGLLGGTRAGQSIYWGWIDDCGRINFTVPGTPPSGGRDTVTSDFAVNDGTWYHVLMTRDINTGEIKLYVNGLLQDHALADPSPRGDVMLNEIGVFQNWDDGSSPMRYLKASIDKLHVYDHAMSDSEAATEFDPRGGPIATPANVRVVYAGASSIGLAWDHVVGASGYEVWRSLAGTGTFAKVAFAPPTGSFTDTGLERRTTYEYRVRTVNPFGESAFSSTAHGTTHVSQWDPPVHIRGTDGDDTIRVEVRGQDVHIWTSPSCFCEEPYYVHPLRGFDGIFIEGMGGSDTIEVDVGAQSSLSGLVNIFAGPGHDDIRVSGAAQFSLSADTGLDDLTLGGGAIVNTWQDQQYGSWVFDGKGTISFFAGTTSIRSITPHAEARIEIGSGTLRLLDSPEHDLMIRRFETMAATARAATPPWSGPRGLTSSRVNSPLAGIAVGTETKVTYNGDANLDGRVNADDYFAIDSGFLAQPTDPLYTQGDFNYDNKINSDDYFLIDSAFLGQTGPFPGFEEVPPPGTAAPSLATTASSSPVTPFSRQRIDRVTRPRRASLLATDSDNLLVATAPLLP